MSKGQTISSGIRILRVFKALGGHAITGISVTELANLVGDSPTNVVRALNTLLEEGMATKLDNGRYAHSVAVLQIAFRHSEHINRLQGRIGELQQRIAAGAQH
jgi:DNA-binding IclR family transcriptional regulator